MNAPAAPPANIPEDGPPPVPRGAALAPGYIVVDFLRRGRDLDVYDLWSESRVSRCVGKRVRPDRLQARSPRGRLLRDGRLLLRLTHPHIVRAYEMLTDPAPLVILETLPGETVAHLIERQQRRLSAGDIAQLGLHLCSAIGYLHRNGMLHLDLKPSNIIATHGMAKVIDLSVARPPGPHPGPIGTRGYRAPEQTLGGDLGPPADVWGIGVTLYEAASGEPACEVGEEATRGGPVESPRQPRPIHRARRLPPRLAATIDQCLRLEPAQRPTVARLHWELQAVVAEIRRA
jgi:serine/threonine protein kinase